MLTAEIKVNGALIGHLYIVNEGFVNTTNVYDEKEIPYLYTYEYYEVGTGKAPMMGVVEHCRSHKALVLINKCIEDIQKQTKEETDK